MATAEAAPSGEGGRKLTGDERRRLAVLGLPTFALALAITVVSTYGPTVARQFTGSATVIGVLIAGEGVGALLLPVAIGSWSDWLRTRIGGRLPFLLVGVPIAAVGLAAIGLAGSLGTMAVAVALFFLGYFVAYGPYRALYPDLMDANVASRAQSTQAVWRGAGTGAALLGGGLLLAAGRELPFALGALTLLLVGAAFVAFGGGVLLSQPYALLIPLMPSDRHGALTGFYSASRGIGVMLGPLLAGVAITLLSGPLASTQGYAATWGVCSAAILLSVPLLLRLPADGQEPA